MLDISLQRMTGHDERRIDFAESPCQLLRRAIEPRIASGHPAPQRGSVQHYGPPPIPIDVQPLHSRTLASSAFVFELGGKQVIDTRKTKGQNPLLRTIERLGECRHGARKPRDHHVVAAMHTQSARGLRRSTVRRVESLVAEPLHRAQRMP